MHFSADVDDLTNMVDPLDNVEAGLLSQGNTHVPLKSVHVRAKLIDLAASVSISFRFSYRSKGFELLSQVVNLLHQMQQANNKNVTIYT